MKDTYHYTACGLDNIYLKNGFSFEKTPYGDGISIKDVDGLHKAIVKSLLFKPFRLVPKEYRFLRGEMKLSQALLANTVGMSEQTVARIEKGETDPSVTYEAIFRALCGEIVLAEKSEIRAILEEITAQADDEYHNNKLLLSEKKGTWSLAA